MFSSVRNLVENSDISVRTGEGPRISSFSPGESPGTNSSMRSLTIPQNFPPVSTMSMIPKVTDPVYGINGIPSLFPGFTFPTPSTFVYDPIAITCM